MKLLETVKDFLELPSEKESKNVSSVVKDDNVVLDTTDNPYIGGFYDESNDFANTFNAKNNNILNDQKKKIDTYRQLSSQPEITEAITEIVNEIVFSYDDKFPIKIDLNFESNDKLEKAITDEFEKIMNMMNIRKNFFSIVKQSYIDGCMYFHLTYDENSTKNGFKQVRMIDPRMLSFDKKSRKFSYKTKDNNFTFVEENSQPKKEYSIEEIVREDFGLYSDNGVCLSYLEYAIKTANTLKTMEDLLVPLRFSRSISRRVFNVDIGDLPSKRGEEVMNNYQSKFKYKKFYNNETGEVSNQQHITSMVEDYWFSNRSGGKGTQVDVLDESGNLGELDDILYFSKKLYKSLNIPLNRINMNPDGDFDFDYDTTRVTKEDMKFFMFISRLRTIYSSAFKEMLKRQVIAKEIMSLSEWNKLENDINIVFVNENKFIEKMKLDNLVSKINIYAEIQEYQGKLFSANTILKEVFRMSDEEMEEEFKKIQEEENNPLYKRFYSNEEENTSW